MSDKENDRERDVAWTRSSEAKLEMMDNMSGLPDHDGSQAANLTIHTYPWPTTDARDLLEENARLKLDLEEITILRDQIHEATIVAQQSDLDAKRELAEANELLDVRHNERLDLERELAEARARGLEFSEDVTRIQKRTRELDSMVRQAEHQHALAEQERDRLREENERLVQRDIDFMDSTSFLRSLGYTRCDIPACNCGSFHKALAGGEGSHE